MSNAAAMRRGMPWGVVPESDSVARRNTYHCIKIAGLFLLDERHRMRDAARGSTERAPMMNIHLSRPGGQREGPFTLDEINRDLAAKKYRETDYWAWYEGLTEWVPLHQVPGIVRSRATEPPAEAPIGEVPQSAAGDTEIIHSQEAIAEDSPAEEPASGETAPEQAASEESPSEGPEAEQTEVHPESGDSESEDVALEKSASEPAVSEEVGPEQPVSEELEPGESMSESGADVATSEKESASQESSPEEEAREEAAPEEPVSEVSEGPLVEEPTSDEPPCEEPAPEEPAFQEVPGGNAEDSQLEAIPPSLAKQLHSGMSFDALEHILLLSSGDAQAASRSAVTSGMLEAAAGEDLNLIRERIPRDAMGGCAFLEKLRGGGSIPELAWRAASTLKPELVQQAREGLYRICVRTFPIETGEMVALFLFYNKQML